LNLSAKTILILSPEPWGLNFVSKHHYALELSNNNRVYFLNPPSSGRRIQKINENLGVINYRPGIRGINRLPAILKNYMNKLDIRKLENLCQVKQFDIIWSFDPFRFQNLKLFRSPLTIYHAVDVHNTPFEKETASTAHIAFTTCEIIRDRILPENPNVYNIGHGVPDHFLIPDRDREIHHPAGKLKVCMMGNLLRKIDFKALFSLIEKYKEAEFHFIGPHSSSNLSKDDVNTSEIDKLKSFENTFLHGSVQQEQLPGLLNTMDLFLILYREDENPASRANPHKLLEYLATGKMILSYELATNLDSKDLIKITTGHDLEKDFNIVIENLSDQNAEKRMKDRKKIAARNTYRKKIAEIQRLIDEKLPLKNIG
jgi:hypothetical protein